MSLLLRFRLRDRRGGRGFRRLFRLLSYGWRSRGTDSRVWGRFRNLLSLYAALL